MVDRIPSGTRDVLPDEMRELRAMTDRIRGVFERARYGEVYTPALEYEDTFTREDRQRAQSVAWANRPAYRMFDEHGNVLVLRSDMTVRISAVPSGGPAPTSSTPAWSSSRDWPRCGRTPR